MRWGLRGRRGERERQGRGQERRGVDATERQMEAGMDMGDRAGERGGDEGARAQAPEQRAVAAAPLGERWRKRRRGSEWGGAVRCWQADGRRWRQRAAVSAWPYWVYRMMDAYELARRVAGEEGYGCWALDCSCCRLC